MKPLLEITNPTYLRRLVREINNVLASGTGVYVEGSPHNVRIKRAKAAPNSRAIVVTACGPLLSQFFAEPDKFIDGYGNSIVASRKAP